MNINRVWKNTTSSNLTASSVTSTLSLSALSSTSVLMNQIITSGSLISWDLQQRYSINGGVTYTEWENVTTGILTSGYTVSNLDYHTKYEFRAVNITVQSTITGNNVTYTTPQLPSRVIQRTSVYPAAFTNGMFQDQEPVESGLSGIPIISGAGRTMLSNFNNITAPTRASGRICYGVRIMFGNMSLSPISGGKMLIGMSIGWNGKWTPRISGVEQNIITGDLTTGWERVTINGDDTLPIPAAEPKESGMPLRCVWSDWMTIPAGWHLGQTSWDFLTRFLLPPRSQAPYALTHAAWSPTDSFARNGVLAGRNNGRAIMYVAAGLQVPIEYHLRAEGDYVTDPANAGLITSVAGQCPPSGVTFVSNKYGPMGIAHTPILAIEYALDPSEIQ